MKIIDLIKEIIKGIKDFIKATGEVDYPELAFEGDSTIGGELKTSQANCDVMFNEINKSKEARQKLSNTLQVEGNVSIREAQEPKVNKDELQKEQEIEIE